MSVPAAHHSKPHHLPKGKEVLAAAVEQVGIIKRSGRILAKTIPAFASDNIVRLGGHFHGVRSRIARWGLLIGQDSVRST